MHLYTRTVGNVFLEVVERRGDYEGYGASNAPVRLAAQAAVARDGPWSEDGDLGPVIRRRR
jgi:4-hydroxyphenylpyruvate dioxygenase